MLSYDSVSIQVSDPCDVVTDVGGAPLAGRLRSFASKSAIVRLDAALAVRGTIIAAIDATPRHASGEFLQGVGPVAAIGTLTRP